MAERLAVTYDPDALERAIALVAERSAADTGRRVEWVRRRLREAVRFCGAHGPEDRDWRAHFALAAPVFALADALGGRVAEGAVRLH